MFFRFGFAALLLSVASFASAIEVSMIDMQDVMENHRIVTDSSDPYGGSSYARGVSLIKSELKNLLVKTANDPSEWHEVQTTFLSATSDIHQDYHQDRKHNEAATLVEEEVGFVALNTNNDAYFDHPDMKVPIREGAFIRFKGSEPHRTVVSKGNVHLLGPFDLKSFGKVGSYDLTPNPTRSVTPSPTKSPKATKSPTKSPTSSPPFPSPTKAPKETKTPKRFRA